jgi:hypothetical protein
MRIVVPHAEWRDHRLHPEVKEALKGQAEFVDVSQSNYAYFDLLERFWGEVEDFCIVEQDILPLAGALQRLEECPASWCTCPYQGPPDLGLIRESLGCARFRAELMAQEPDIFTLAEELNTRQWYGVDLGLATALKRRGHSVHVHPDEAQHLRRYE